MNFHCFREKERGILAIKSCARANCDHAYGGKKENKTLPMEGGISFLLRSNKFVVDPPFTKKGKKKKIFLKVLRRGREKGKKKKKEKIDEAEAECNDEPHRRGKEGLL